MMRISYFRSAAFVSIAALLGCETMSTGEGALAGGVLGGVLGQFLGDAKGAALGAAFGAAFGAIAVNEWKNAKNREAQREVVKTQEQVNQEYLVASNAKRVPRRTTLELVDANVTPDRVGENQEITCAARYRVIGEDTVGYTVCRTDMLHFLLPEENKAISVARLTQRCDLYGSGEVTHGEVYVIPLNVPHGQYQLLCEFQLEKNGKKQGQPIRRVVPFHVGEAAPVAAPPGPAADVSVQTYVIQSGDTLGVIAQRFNTTVDELMRLNGISDPNRIRVGQQLNVPAR